MMRLAGWYAVGVYVVVSHGGVVLSDVAIVMACVMNVSIEKGLSHIVLPLLSEQCQS